MFKALTKSLDLPQTDRYISPIDRKYIESKILSQKRIIREKGICKTIDKCKNCLHGSQRENVLDAVADMLRSIGVIDQNIYFLAARFMDMGISAIETPMSSQLQLLPIPTALVAAYLAIKCAEVDFDTSIVSACFRYMCAHIDVNIDKYRSVCDRKEGDEKSSRNSSGIVRSIELELLNNIKFDLITAGTPLTFLVDMTGWGSYNSACSLSHNCLCITNQHLQIEQSLRLLYSYTRKHCCFEHDSLDVAFAVQSAVRDSPFVYTLSVPRYLEQESEVDISEVSKIRKLLFLPAITRNPTDVVME